MKRANTDMDRGAEGKVVEIRDRATTQLAGNSLLIQKKKYKKQIFTALLSRKIESSTNLKYMQQQKEFVQLTEVLC
ncbi:hypothetical protein LOS20_16005 [Enterococcus faecium]|nr:hypothetical protein [Enterococcus faecium]